MKLTKRTYVLSTTGLAPVVALFQIKSGHAVKLVLMSVRGGRYEGTLILSQLVTSQYTLL